MSILVTRPERASLRTRARLEKDGHTVLTDPLLALDFKPPEKLIEGDDPDAVVITSSNGARAVAHHPDLVRLIKLPVWTVGARTTAATTELGFAAPRGEAPDVASLAAMIAKEPPGRLLYLAAEARAKDLSGLLPAHEVDIRVVYSAEPKTAFEAETAEALRAGRIKIVLHYSRRLAETYLALADAAGLGAEALLPRQFCLSEQVAEPLKAAGAAEVKIASSPNEEALLALLRA